MTSFPWGFKNLLSSSSSSALSSQLTFFCSLWETELPHDDLSRFYVTANNSLTLRVITGWTRAEETLPDLSSYYDKCTTHYHHTENHLRAVNHSFWHYLKTVSYRSFTLWSRKKHYFIFFLLLSNHFLSCCSGYLSKCLFHMITAVKTQTKVFQQ